jgi:hypothetical protein
VGERQVGWYPSLSQPQWPPSNLYCRTSQHHHHRFSHPNLQTHTPSLTTTSTTTTITMAHLPNTHSPTLPLAHPPTRSPIDSLTRPHTNPTTHPPSPPSPPNIRCSLGGLVLLVGALGLLLNFLFVARSLLMTPPSRVAVCAGKRLLGLLGGGVDGWLDGGSTGRWTAGRVGRKANE